MTTAAIDPKALAKLISQAVRAAIDQRLGTQRPQTPKRMSLPFDLTRKFVSGGKRIVRGVASTGSLDRQGDVVEPRGGTWRLPIPLLWAHDHNRPIGAVRQAVASASGITIEAEIVEGIDDADRAWKLIEAAAVDSFSIGFVGIKAEPITTGTRWTKWELIEVSVVACPANRDARIARSIRGDGSVPLRDLRGSVRLITRESK